MRNLAFASLFALGCASSAGSASTQQGLTLNQPPANVDFASSMLVTDHATLDAIYPSFHIGAVMYAENAYLDFIKFGQKSNSEFASSAFHGAATDVANHNAYTGLKVGTVPFIYNSWANVVLPNFDPDNGTEPFHLIAVVNRLDLAGDMDMRSGGQLAALDRRWFGEGRLVYAVDATLDGQPYPVTVILEYRLPALMRDADGEIVLDPSFSFANGPVSEADWAERRQLWALVWQDLSTYPLGSPQYIAELEEIMSWFAYGSTYAERETTQNAQNHLSIRSGEQVQSLISVNQTGEGQLTGEFEYREFYLDAAAGYSTRKLRRETFDCANNSANTLPDRIANEWVGSGSSADLAWNYMLGPRDMTNAEIADVEAATACNGQLPYGQQDDANPKLDEFRAKFARLMANTVWQQDYIASEAQTHAFAAGTCTGCHAGEAAGTGFQIAPPLDGHDAGLSPFLTGPMQVTPRGTTYDLDERGRRKTLLTQFAAGETPADDSLLQDMACNNIQTCTIE